MIDNISDLQYRLYDLCFEYLRCKDRNLRRVIYRDICNLQKSLLELNPTGTKTEVECAVILSALREELKDSDGEHVFGGFRCYSGDSKRVKALFKKYVASIDMALVALYKYINDNRPTEQLVDKSSIPLIKWDLEEEADG